MAPKKRDRDEVGHHPSLSTTDTSPSKTLRRNILGLWSTVSHLSQLDPVSNLPIINELDRYMIALYRFQTEGKVAYGELVGIHNGGWRTKDDSVNRIMYTKASKDAQQAYPNVSQPGDPKPPNPDVQHDDSVPGGEGEVEGVFWPGRQPNVVLEPVTFKTPDASPDKETWHMAHQFCWHASSPFFVWHRPYCLMFERGLQKYDPRNAGFSGNAALGLHYFKWEDWDGTSLHPLFSAPTYTFRSDEFSPKYKKGSSIPNPLLRWFAPRTFQNQKDEVFPSKLDDTNCTTRDPAFFNGTAEFTGTFPIVSGPDMTSPSGSIRPGAAMGEIVAKSMTLPWMHFATMSSEGGSPYSAETSHNKFHNHLGGLTIAPSPNPKDPVNGTMTTNQSPFDPIFWVHHSNVERQLMSWQKRNVTTDPGPVEELRAFVLYPWTSPDISLKPGGDWGLHTPSSTVNDGTYGAWYDAYSNLPYEYEEYVQPPQESPAQGIRGGIVLGRSRRLSLIADVAKTSIRRGGAEYLLLMDGTVVSSMALISEMGGNCPRCNSKAFVQIQFDVSGVEKLQAVAEQNSDSNTPFAVPPSVAAHLSVSVHRSEARANVLAFHLVYAAVGLRGIDAQTHAANMHGRTLLASVAKVNVNAIQPSTVMRDCCLGKGHCSLDTLLFKRLRVSATASWASLGVSWDQLSKEAGVTRAVRAVRDKRGYSVEFSNNVDDPAANVFVVVSPIDGPVLNPVAFTSHFKGSHLQRFDAVPFRPPAGVNDCVVLYVSPVVARSQLKPPVSDYVKRVSSIVGHLLLHAAGFEHNEAEGFSATLQ